MRLCLMTVVILAHVCVSKSTKVKKLLANETVYDEEFDKARAALIESLKNHILQKLGINETTIPGNDTETPVVANPQNIARQNLFVADQPSSNQHQLRPSSLTFLQPNCNQNERTEQGAAEFILPVHFDLSTIARHSLQLVLLTFRKTTLSSNNPQVFCPQVADAFHHQQNQKLIINLYHLSGVASNGKAKRELIDNRLDSFDGDKQITFDISNFAFLQLPRTSEFDLLIEFQDLSGRNIRSENVIQPKSCKGKNSSCSQLKCGVSLQVWVYQDANKIRRRVSRSAGVENEAGCDSSESCCLRSLNLNLEETEIDWILTPKNLSLNFCFGFCRGKQLSNNTSVCLPSKFDNVTISYVNQQNQVAKKDFQVNATECSCFSNKIPRIAQTILSSSPSQDEN